MSYRSNGVADGGGGFEDVKERPSWLIPLILFVITLILAGVVIWGYFGPTVDDLTGQRYTGSSSEAQVQVEVDGINLSIPQNYMQIARDRRGGAMDSVLMYALMPSFKPYDSSLESIFTSTDAESPIVHFSVSVYRHPMSESERYELLYAGKAVPAPDLTSPEGLTAYRFNDDTGYQDEDLFVFTYSDGTTGLFRCLRQTDTISAPHCRRDMRLENGLALSYWFKRPYLDRWRSIDAGVRALGERFVLTGNAG